MGSKMVLAQVEFLPWKGRYNKRVDVAVDLAMCCNNIPVIQVKIRFL